MKGQWFGSRRFPSCAVALALALALPACSDDDETDDDAASDDGGGNDSGGNDGGGDDDGDNDGDGGDGNGGDGGTAECSPSGVDPNKSVDQLSQAELTDICETAGDCMTDDEIVRYLCYFSSVRQHGSDRAACERTARGCIEVAPPPDRGEYTCEFSPEELPTCAGLVSADELDRCYHAIAERFKDVSSAVSCETPVDGFELTPPTECEPVARKCEDLLDV